MYDNKKAKSKKLPQVMNEINETVWMILRISNTSRPNSSFSGNLKITTNNRNHYKNYIQSRKALYLELVRISWH